MKKEELNSLLKEYAKNNLSPTKLERKLASDLFESVKKAIGESCLLTGSYARFTSTRPIHDIDILYIAGEFAPQNIEPQKVLDELEKMLADGFVSPIELSYIISVQSHSITISFSEDREEKFAVDIVPAFIAGLKNEFGDDIYYVPEIFKASHRKRSILYEEYSKIKKNEREWWIKSDPRGYIKIASNLNKANNDFRKTVKIIKRWKFNCKELDDNFKLKSFHVEQIATKYFQQNIETDIFDSVFNFFYKLPEMLDKANIPDRADISIMIDEYINNLTNNEKELILRARDCFLIKLEEIDKRPSINNLLEACFYKRAGSSEEYLFDHGIPVLIEPTSSFKIDGYVKPLQGYSAGWLRETPQLQKGLTRGEGKTRYIKFETVIDNVNADIHKWKVKNDNTCEQPRGEITDYHTLRVPESTAFPGNHYVECFAIKDDVCVARSKVNVIIK
jgi:Adenylyl/Guanylyl and SMODS C-terminal sensor domain